MFGTTAIRKLDAQWGIPRPADRQHYSSWRAMFDFAGASLQAAVFVALGLVATYFIWGTFSNLNLGGYYYQAMALALCFVAVVMGFADAATLAAPYYRINRRESHGNQAWATAEELRERGLVVPRGTPSTPSHVRIGYFAECFRRYELVIPVDRMFRHIAVFGPPGSGKSKTFFMPVIRQWLAFGSVMALDAKGELSLYCAGFAKEYYRLDLEEPTLSDRIDLIGSCKGDPELAHELAATIVGLDDAAKNAKEIFWPLAETALLKALLLYLSIAEERAHPAMVRELLANYPGEELGLLLESTGDPDILEAWRMFRQAKPELQGSVRIGLATVLDGFNSPNATILCTPPDDEELALGIRLFDLKRLREPGTLAAVVVSEGNAGRFDVVLSTIFGVVQSALRDSGAKGETTPALFAIDEAGNIKLRHLSERVGVGRSLGTCYMLGYQGISQARKQFGSEGADAIFDSVGTYIFLGGLGARTCEYAMTLLGRTTTWSTQTVDAVARANDHVRITEIGRHLMDAADIRQLLEYTEAIMVHVSEAPIRFAMAGQVKGGPLTPPRKFPINTGEWRRPMRPLETSAALLVDAARSGPTVVPASAVRAELEAGAAPAATPGAKGSPLVPKKEGRGAKEMPSEPSPLLFDLANRAEGAPREGSGGADGACEGSSGQAAQP